MEVVVQVKVSNFYQFIYMCLLRNTMSVRRKKKHFRNNSDSLTVDCRKYKLSNSLNSKRQIDALHLTKNNFFTDKNSHNEKVANI